MNTGAAVVCLEGKGTFIASIHETTTADGFGYIHRVPIEGMT